MSSYYAKPVACSKSEVGCTYVFRTGIGSDVISVSNRLKVCRPALSTATAHYKRTGIPCAPRVLSSGEEYGIARQTTLTEWLYTPRDVTDLLRRLGFDSIAYDDTPQDGRSRPSPLEVPRFVVHCRAGRPSATLRLVPGL